MQASAYRKRVHGTPQKADIMMIGTSELIRLSAGAIASRPRISG